jgi:hypothetical protein
VKLVSAYDVMYISCFEIILEFSGQLYAYRLADVLLAEPTSESLLAGGELFFYLLFCSAMDIRQQSVN